MNPIELNGLQLESFGRAEAPTGIGHVLWRRKWGILLILILCIGAAAGYLMLAKPIYSSTAMLYVEPSGPWMMGDNEHSAPPNYAYTQAQVIQSAPVLSLALDQPGIRQLPSFRESADPLKDLQDALETTVGEKDDVISITCSSPYRQDTAPITQAVVDSYLAYQASHKRSSATDMLKVLQKEKITQEQQRTDWLKTILKFKQENQAISFDLDKTNVTMDRLSALGNAVTAAQLDATQAQADMDAAQKAAKDPNKVIQLVQAQQVANTRLAVDLEDSSLHNTLNQLQLQLSNLQQDLGTDAPAVRAAQQKIEHVKAQLVDRDRRFAEAYMAYMQQRLESANEKLAKVRESYDAQLKQAQEVNVKAAEYALLDAELKRTERAADLLDTRIKEVNVTGGTGGLNVSVVQAAQVPQEATKPKKKIVMAGALVMGLFLGFGWAIFRERTDRRLRSSKEIATLVSAPVLGAVPEMPRPHAPSKTGQFILGNRGSAVAEAYRTIRTNIYSRATGKEGLVLQITSPCASEGKTTLVSNLGIAMAQSGNKTLILDADIKNPTLHKIFALTENGGLHGLLSGEAKAGDCIQSTSIDNLDVLPCGSPSGVLGDVLSGPRFTELLRELGSKYRYILVDSPPVADLADSRILAASCDATLLVVRAGQSDCMSAEQAKHGIVEAGGKILGVVVNAVTGPTYRYATAGYGEYGPKVAAYAGQDKTLFESQ